MTVAGRAAGGHPPIPMEPAGRPTPARWNKTSAVVAVFVGALVLVLIAWALSADRYLVLPGMLFIVGVALAANPGRWTSLLVATGLLLILSIFLQYVTPASWEFGHTFGSRSVAPKSAATEEIEFNHAVGTLHVDLTRTEWEEAGAVSATTGLGTLVVAVPADVNVDVAAQAGIGTINLFGEQRSVLGASLVTSERVPNATQTLKLNLSVGAGSLEVRR